MSNYFNDDILNEGIYTMANPSKNTVKDLGKVADHFLKVKESEPKYVEDKRSRENKDWMEKQDKLKRTEATAKANAEKLKQDQIRIELHKKNMTPEDLVNFRGPNNKETYVNDANANSLSNKNNSPDPKIPSATIHPQELRHKVSTAINQVYGDPKSVATNLYKNNKGAVLGTAAGAAAAVGIGAIVANILKKRKWKMDGCNNIEDPSKKQQCKAYIVKKNISDIKSQCKYANNPEKCKRIAMEKLREN